MSHQIVKHYRAMKRVDFQRDPEMRTHHLLVLPLIAAFLAGCEQQQNGRQAQNDADGEARQHETDNTGRNARDREGNTLTPADQNNNEKDLQITQDVRRALTDDKEMSVNARNVKIITRDAVVTLRGPVDSDAEKSKVEAKAKAVGGVARVESQLETVRR
jgi:hyperosmotically inducible periplasmic protein